jgi:hypothetical protein
MSLRQIKSLEMRTVNTNYHSLNAQFLAKFLANGAKCIGSLRTPNGSG